MIFMALSSNSKEQIAKRLKANLGLRFPGYSVASAVDTNGNPALILTNASAVDVAAFVVARRSFVGFNVVAELSASAAEGLPEHVLMVACRSDASQLVTADIFMSAHEMGTSSLTLAFPAAATVAAAIDTAQQVQEFVNDARLGAVGT
jgi:hypothetical protein